MPKSIEEYARTQTYVPARAEKRKHPEGWEPGVVLDGDTGSITTRPTEARSPRWDEHLRSWGFDPEEFDVLEPVQVRTWDFATKDGIRQMWYYRANIVKRKDAAPDISKLVSEIRRHRPRKQPAPTGDAAFVVGPADWQMGKKDGDGTEGTVQRVLESIDAIERRVAELRRGGRELGTLVLAGMGDFIESCDGQYPMQAFSVELDRRGQVNVVRRLLLKMIQRLAPRFPRVIIPAVPGNHGENRKDGKAFTTFGDNDDVAIFEQLHDILKENPDTYGHVSFVIPDEDLTVTLDISGQIVAFAHGHQAKSGGSTPQLRVEKWWKGQQHAKRPAGDADILLTAHYHHLAVVQDGPRTWLQCPSLDGGSTWWDESRGGSAPPGILTMTIGPDGWGDLAVL